MANRTRHAGEASLSLYGRTYWDAEVDVDLSTLATGKGKVDTRVRVRHGGFAVNAARALGSVFDAGEVRVVTVTSWLDRPRLLAALPEGVALDAILGEDLAPPPVSVIINPARECRILRDPGEDDGARWKMEDVPLGALAARLHVCGRLPEAFVARLLERAHASGARVGWVGGDAVSPALEQELDLMCVNTREAKRLVGREGSPLELAKVLAHRARPVDAVRVVTGAGGAPTAAAFRDRGVVRVAQAAPAAVPPRQIATLLGVGDAFAAHFFAAACFDADGRARRRLDVRLGLKAAQRAAARALRSAGPR